MADLRQETIDTYNKSAKELAEYFRGIGPRVKYIDFAFELAGNPDNANVIEIGCGDGRDAKEIIKKTHSYIGFDISEELIKLAKKHVPTAEFVVADAVTFEYPEDLDIVFTFASLLHLNKEEVKMVFTKVNKALKPGGIFYISLKWSPRYRKTVKEDEHGKRLFYLYNAKIIKSLAGAGYKLEDTWREVRGHTDWFEIALRKSD